MLLFILKTLSFCLSLFAWLLLSVAGGSLIWESRLVKKNSIRPLSLIIIMWGILSYNICSDNYLFLAVYRYSEFLFYLCLITVYLICALIASYIMGKTFLYRLLMHKLRGYVSPQIVRLPIGIASGNNAFDNRQRMENVHFTSDMKKRIHDVLDNPNLLQERNITMEKTTNLIGVNVFYLRTYLNYHLQTTLAKYLRDKRLDYAEQLLLGTDKSVAEIATMTGFESDAKFFEAFKARHQSTPLAWRKSKSSLE